MAPCITPFCALYGFKLYYKLLVYYFATLFSLHLLSNNLFPSFILLLSICSFTLSSNSPAILLFSICYFFPLLSICLTIALLFSICSSVTLYYLLLNCFVILHFLILFCYYLFELLLLYYCLFSHNCLFF